MTIITLLPIFMLPAPAGDIACASAAKGMIAVDGLLDDWNDIPAGPAVVGPDPSSAGFDVRCAYDATTLFLAVDVVDDRLVRTKAHTQDDHLVLDFGAASLTIFPASGEARLPRVIAWSDKRSRRLALVESLQPRGWSVELSIPLADVPGWRARAASVSFHIDFHDSDELARAAVSVLAGPRGRLVFSEADAIFTKFLATNDLTPRDVRVDTIANLGDGPRRVVAAGKLVGVLSDDGFVYLDLPVADAHDVLEVRPVELSGKGKASLLVRTIERGEGGSREVLAFWTLDGSHFSRTFAHELSKQQGTGHMTNRWQLVPKTKGHGFDLVVTTGEVTGFTAETWNESPAEDMAPILLPWAPKKKEVWHFEDGAVSGG